MLKQNVSQFRFGKDNELDDSSLQFCTYSSPCQSLCYFLFLCPELEIPGQKKENVEIKKQKAKLMCPSFCIVKTSTILDERERRDQLEAATKRIELNRYIFLLFLFSIFLLHQHKLNSNKKSEENPTDFHLFFFLSRSFYYCFIHPSNRTVEQNRLVKRKKSEFSF